MLRRRRREGGDLSGTDGSTVGVRQDEADARETADASSGPGQDDSPELAGLAAGPWDVAADYPDGERIDCGSLLIPVRDGFDVQINVAEEQGFWVAVVHGESGMQLQAFAAPRSGGLWDEVRREIAENIGESTGSCKEEYGAFGAELHAQVPMGDAGQAGQPDHPDQPHHADQNGQPGHAAEPGTTVEPGQADQPLQSVRFLGFDGPRWFLRGVISGPAAQDRDQGALFDALFADIVVVRGDHPAPPREQLEIRLPEEARQALEAQFAQENEGWELPNPFERGPEITETR